MSWTIVLTDIVSKGGLTVVLGSGKPLKSPGNSVFTQPILGYSLDVVPHIHLTGRIYLHQKHQVMTQGQFPRQGGRVEDQVDTVYRLN